jgi:molecular chaperone DnaK
MTKEVLQKLSGRTLNSTLSPDQSIAHGAAYYAGMLLSNSKYARSVFGSQTSARLAKIRQQSVNARSLGIMIRNVESGDLVPHYIILANALLPVSKTHVFGTVVANQTSVHVRIVESGAGPDNPPTEIGECHITKLPTGLPKNSQVEVTISYDTDALVHVTARELKNDYSAEVNFIRQENLSEKLQNTSNILVPKAPKPVVVASKPTTETQKEPALTVSGQPLTTPEQSQTESAEEIVLRCPTCSAPLNNNGECDTETCLTDSQAIRKWVASTSKADLPSTGSAEEEFWNLVDEE